MSLTAELVALCERIEPDPGPPPGQIGVSDEEIDALVEGLIRQLDGKPLWIFAYGSLLWKPACTTAEVLRGVAYGWRRNFSLEMTRWRGSPAQPGLMLGLNRGGFCEGMVYRLSDDERQTNLRKLMLREVDSTEDAKIIRSIEVQTETGHVNALVFWAGDIDNPIFVNHDIATQAKMLARACGHIGSGAAYLHNTVKKLEELGMADDYLWELQELVADEIGFAAGL